MEIISTSTWLRFATRVGNLSYYCRSSICRLSCCLRPLLQTHANSLQDLLTPWCLGVAVFRAEDGSTPTELLYSFKKAIRNSLGDWLSSTVGGWLEACCLFIIC